jgi:hypothetical protein
MVGDPEGGGYSAHPQLLQIAKKLTHSDYSPHVLAQLPQLKA